MRNDERFIVAFNQIEKYLMQEIKEDRHVPFHRAVQRLRKQNAGVNRYHNDLLEFSELRNAIVHERTDHQYTIADPHDKTVQTIEEIAKILTKPESVIPLFKKTLRTVQADLKVKDVLGIIKETDYSQFPVYKSKQFIGLLTDKAIIHWIAKEMNGDLNQLFGVNVGKIIKDEEAYCINFDFISQETSIYDAEERFIRALRKNKKLDALLITETGDKNEKLMGMITPKDLIHIT